MEFLGRGFEGFCNAIEQSDIRIAFCERFDETGDIWNVGSHKHDLIEIMYFLSGAAETIVAGTPLKISHHDFVIYPKDAFHMEHLRDGQHQEVICIRVDIPGLDLPSPIHMQDKDANVQWMLDKLYREYHCDKRCDALMNHYIKAAVLYIARIAFSMDVESDPLSGVILYIREHASDPLTVENLAGLIYVSQSYLCRIFKQRTGMSITEYIRAIRVETAQNLLASTDKSIEEVSEIVGYNSPKYFYKAFRTCTGWSPREFRKSCRR